MSRRPIGDVPMSNAERSRRRRIKAKAALRDAAPSPPGVQANGSAAPPAGKPGADYPRMLYHPDGRTTVVDTPEAHDRLKPDGWEMAPLAVHRRRPVSHHGVLGADTLFARPLPRW